MRFHHYLLLLLCMAFGGCASQKPHTETTRTETTNAEPTKPWQPISKEFEQCRSEAMAMDSSAQRQQSTAQYHRAAVLFEHCVNTYSIYAEDIPADDMIELQALSVLGYIKAGELELASRQLQLMQSAFPHHDIYLQDGSSFIDSMTLLLTANITNQTQQRLLNTSKAVTSEFKRRQYWLHH